MENIVKQQEDYYERAKISQETSKTWAENYV